MLDKEINFVNLISNIESQANLMSKKFIATVRINGKGPFNINLEAGSRYAAKNQLEAQYGRGSVIRLYEDLITDMNERRIKREKETADERAREAEKKRSNNYYERRIKREKETADERAREAEKKRSNNYYEDEYEINNQKVSGNWLSNILSKVLGQVIWWGLILLACYFFLPIIASNVRKNEDIERINAQKSERETEEWVKSQRENEISNEIKANKERDEFERNTSNTREKKDTTLDKQPEISDGYPFGSKIHMNGGNNYQKSYHGFILNIKPHKEDLLVLNGQYDDVLEIYLEQADAGDINAMHNLGLMYIKGLGVNKDLQKGIEYLEKSAENRKWDADSVPLEKARKQLRNSESLQ